MRRLLALVLAAAAGCTPQVPVSTPEALSSLGPEGADMTAALVRNTLPPADPFDLSRRVKGRDGLPAQLFEPVRTSPPAEDVGTAREFWTYDDQHKVNVRVTATLRLLTDHAKWWVANDVTTVADDPLRATADTFESRIYPTDRKSFGSEWSPGIDGDPRINVLVAKLPGRAAGYFSAADEYPTWVNPYSAEREMIYVNALSARFGSDSLFSVLAHEFCHMIQFNKRARLVVWFAEGHAQQCERLNNFGTGFATTFLRVPDTQLDDWSENAPQANYGAAFLFLEFLRQHAGGEDLLNALMAHGVENPEDIDAVLRQRGQAGIEEQFADFVASNALIGISADARYAYGGLRLAAAGPAEQDHLAVGSTLRSSVHEYAARYVELPRSAFHLRFTGATATRVIPADAHSGKALWWSDRADLLDSTLTRIVDLRTASSLTLSFWTWFEIEKDWDYAYVEVSTDGGARWATLSAEGTTTTDPNGNNLGAGFTGVSGGATGPAWVQQHVDLSTYAGQVILLRFEYVTDQALDLNGFAIDDIAIPGALFDDAEADNGWQARGFIRSTNLVHQRFVLQLLRFGDRATVERQVVDGGSFELDLDSSTDRRAPLLAVTGFAPRTTQPAAFAVALEAKR